eukprot:gene21726-28745_t
MGVSAGLWSHWFVLPARSGSAGSQAAWVGIRSVASSCVVASSVQGKGQAEAVSVGASHMCGLHELLGLLTNLIPGCPEARSQLGSSPITSSASDSSPSMITLLLGHLFKEQGTYMMITDLLRHLSSNEDGAELLLKGGADFLSAAHKSLQDLDSGKRKAKGVARQQGIMQVLINLAAFSEGQRCMLRCTAAPALLELMCRHLTPPEGAIPPPPAISLAALRLLRNLSFSPDAKTHLLANPNVLPALLAHIEHYTTTAPESASASAALRSKSPAMAGKEAVAAEAAAYASSAVWALIYHGEKVKAALRRLPSAVPRLIMVKAACEFRLAKLAKAPQERIQSKTTQLGKAPPEGQLMQWLQSTLSTISTIVDSMNSTGKGMAKVDADVKGARDVRMVTFL